jgi:predicted DNA-binding ribbon-helix-helix protein
MGVDEARHSLGLPRMRHLQKRSVSLAGHRTSIALEPAFWAALDEAARQRRVSLAALVAQVDAARPDAAVPLASALRVFALEAAWGGAGDFR